MIDAAQVVTVVVPNWNQWALTLACIAALEELEEENLDIVVVENGSSDESARRLGAACRDGRFSLIVSTVNRGYAGAANLGIERALECGADAVWILNNDAVPQTGTLQAMRAALNGGPRRGAVSSREIRPADRTTLPSAFDQSARGFVPVVCEGCERAFHRAGVVTGPSILYRVEALRETGFFDESYFHYFEEVDLVERLRRAGWVAGLACTAAVLHDRGSSLAAGPQAHYYFIRNDLLYRSRFANRPVWRLLGRRHTIGRALSLRSAAPRTSVAGAVALVDAVRGRHGPRPLTRRG